MSVSGSRPYRQCSVCLQCVEDVEEALNSYLVHREENENAKLQTFEQELSRLLVSSGPEELEHVLLAFIGQRTFTINPNHQSWQFINRLRLCNYQPGYRKLLAC